MNLSEAQHNEAKAKIKSIVEKMGEDDFIQFYIDSNEKINRRVITRKEVENLIKKSPKYMTWVIDTLMSDLRMEVQRNDK